MAHGQFPVEQTTIGRNTEVLHCLSTLEMKITTNLRKIQLIYEDLTNCMTMTTVRSKLPLPKFIIDVNGKLFVKNKTIFEVGHPSVTCYSEVPVTFLLNIEVVS